MHTVQHRSRRRAIACAAAAACLAILAGGAVSAQADAAPSCTPGTGAQLAGKHVTQAEAETSAGLQCADLRNADLSGVDLIQADLSGVLATGANFSGVQLGQADLSAAKLGGADLRGADLTQATLTAADFSNANLAHATLIQVDAADTTWTGADLSDVNATQAHLTGATFENAKLGGSDFTQADLDNTDFSRARGLTPWSTYVLIAAGAVFLLFAGVAARRAMKRRGHTDRRQPADTTADQPSAPHSWPSALGRWITGREGDAPSVQSAGAVTQPAVPLVKPAAALGAFHPINPSGRATRGPAATLAIGLLGALLAAFGVHLFVGGAIGSFSFAYDTLATTTCSGPQCAVGVDSGTLGLIGGVFVILAGLYVVARA